MRLLPRERLVKTGPVDYADWNYRFILGRIQRLRFSLAVSLLPKRSHRLLEIGFGSGVLMPALGELTDALYGIEVHNNIAKVTSVLEHEDAYATLVQAEAEKIPFRDNCFDSVVAVSSLEFVHDLNSVCAEIRRVLKVDGVFVVVTPASTMIADAGLKLLTGNSAQRDFGDRRQAIVSTLLSSFNVDRHIVAPPLIGVLVPLYHAFRLRRPEINEQICHQDPLQHLAGEAFRPYGCTHDITPEEASRPASQGSSRVSGRRDRLRALMRADAARSDTQTSQPPASRV
jgi:SAM-dependent methyltransferase